MTHACYFKNDVKLNESNYSFQNPVFKGDVKRKKLNGNYEYEKFYIIDFYDIRKDYYIISSFGRIYSLKSKKEMKTKNRNGYSVITLMTDKGGHKTFLVHCLVARAFVPKTLNDKKLGRMFVHHKNWDRDYNYYWNLEWRSAIELAYLGKLSNMEEVNDDIIKIICRLLEVKTPIIDIYNMVDKKISKDKISKIKNKQLYTTISQDYIF